MTWPMNRERWSALCIRSTNVPIPSQNLQQRITDELPVDVALGKLDYMEIVGFSDHKSTAAVWYKLLNLGFKFRPEQERTPTAELCSAYSGNGWPRPSLYLDAGWPATSTLDGRIEQGRTFATNGPLIEFKLGGEMVGSELKFDSYPKAVPFTAKFRSIVPVDHLELVCNGKVAQELTLDRFPRFSGRNRDRFLSGKRLVPASSME